MPNRILRDGINKRQRFEIFKRDSFTCQYCGRRPPLVVLEVDHIHPHALGGDNDELNLITACFDCNSGKSDKPLGAVLIKPDADLKFLEIQQEIAEAQRYLLAKKELAKYEEPLVQEIMKLWDTHLGWKAPFTDQVKRWLIEYGPDAIEEAILSLADQYRRRHVNFKTSAVDYVSGILWNRHRKVANG